jgi:rod shape-determining protein MreC
LSRLLERPRATLILLVLISISLISINFRAPRLGLSSVKSLVTGVVDPARSALDSVFHPLADAWHGAVDYGAEARQVAELRAQVGRLERQTYEQDGVLRAFSQLSRLTDLPFATTIAKTPAEVVGVTPSNLQLSFEIDRGSDAGVQVGNPVVGGAGLAGRVIQVTRTTATVLEVTDPSSVVGVRIPRTGQVGALQGQGVGQPLAVNLVVPGTPLRVGTVLLTSGLQGELFPPGIPAARVTSVANPSGDLQDQIRAVPLVDYQTLQYVDVLHWVPGSGG